MSKPIANHLYTFPPFPKPPDGVKIMEFKDFQEKGYQIQIIEEEEEVDGLGIPTVALRHKHDTDVCKTNTRVKKRVAEPEIVKNPDGSSRKKTWYEQWEDTENLRYVGGYNPNQARADRLHEATSNFNRRSWPPVNTQVRALWDQFQLFIGILTNTPIWNMKAEDQAEEDVSDDDTLSDDEPDATTQEAKKINVNMTQNTGGGGGQRKPKRPKSRPPYANYGKKPVIVHNQEEVEELLIQAREEKEERLIEFLNEPAKGVQIFLSSYMRRQGLHFSDRNLDILPRLLRFYIRFLIGNRVLPESEHNLNRALDIIEQARQELPLTSKIAKILPDNLSRACEECYGVKDINYKLAMDEVNASYEPYTAVSTATSEIANGTPDVEIEEVTSPALQPEHKTFELENAEDVTEVQDQEVFEESLKAGNIQILSQPAPNSATDLSSDANTEAPQANDANGTWGDTGSWGSAAPTADSEVWDTPDIEWIIPDPEHLMKFLGPTALPLTHTSGIVEWSVRRIKSVTLPAAVTGNAQQQPKRKNAENAEAEPDPEAVEEELEMNFAKVVLEPWLEWEDPMEEPQACKPRILASSRGRVLLQDGVSFDGNTKASAVTGTEDSSSASKIRPHDPLKDEIVLLAEPESTKVLRVGMGLGGSWVQIARIGDFLEGETGAASAQEGRPKSKKSKKSDRRFWYLNELMVTLTSYHLVG